MTFCRAKAIERTALLFLAFFALPLPPEANDLQKSQKKELESAAKALNDEAKSLEKSGKLVEARLKYAESLGYIESKDALSSISRLDDKLKEEAKAAIASAQKLYDAGKYKEAAQSLEAALDLEAEHPLIAFNLALCYQQLGERQKARDYLDQAIAGGGNPKVRTRLNEVRTVLTTSEAPTAQTDTSKKQLQLFNHLAETLAGR